MRLLIALGSINEYEGLGTLYIITICSYKICESSILDKEIDLGDSMLLKLIKHICKPLFVAKVALIKLIIIIESEAYY